VNTTTPIDVAASATSNSGTAPTAPAITTVTANTILVAFYLAVDGGATGPTWTAPSGYINGFTTTTTKATGANAALAGYGKALAAAGASGSPAAGINSNGLNRWIAALLAVRPA